MLFICLTGGLATGKTTVIDMFKKSGVPVVSVDDISRDITSVGSAALAEIAKAFGEGCLNEDGSLSNHNLVGVIGDNSERIEILENIMNIAIGKVAEEELSAIMADGGTIVVVENSSVFETNSHKNYDGIVVVTSTLDTQVERLISRSGRSEEIVRSAISHQMPLVNKEALSQYLIRNDGDLEALDKEVQAVLTQLKSQVLTQLESQALTGAVENHETP